MKITFNNSRSKPRKKTIQNLMDSGTIPPANRKPRARINSSRPRAPPGIPRNLIYGQYTNTPLIERIGQNSLNSDVEFFLTSSEHESEAPRSSKCVEVPMALPKVEPRVASGSYGDKMNQLFDKRHGIEDLDIKHREDFNTSELLNSKDENLKKTLYNIPHYFYRLKNEYVSYKGKYEKAAEDLLEQIRTTELLQKRANELIEEDKGKRERILALTEENEVLKRSRVQEGLYDKERERLIEIVKKEGERREEEMRRLLEENSRMKCENSRQGVEIEIERRKGEEGRRRQRELEGESEVLKMRIEGVEILIKDMIERYRRSEVFERIESVIKENKQVIYYRVFEERVKEDLKGLREGMMRVEEGREELVRRIEEEEGRRRRKEEEERGILRLVEKIEGEVIEAQRGILEVKKQAETIESGLGIEKLRKEFKEILENQKRETEAMRQGYERRIKEASGAEEEEEIWDVF